MKAKYAGKELMLHPAMVVLISVQTIIVFVTLLSMVSIIVSRYHRYHEIEGLISGNGRSGHLIYLQHQDGKNNIQTSEQAKKNLPYGKASASYKWAFEIDGDKQEVSMTGYDDGLWKCHEPTMDAGRWFRDEDAKSGELEVVIAQENGAKGKYNVGDKIYMRPEMIGEMLDSGTENHTRENQIYLKVVGIIREGAAVLGTEAASPKTTDYRSYFWNYHWSFEKKMYIFGIQDDLYHYKMQKAPGWYTSMSGLAFLSWDTDDSEKINENEKYLMEHGMFLAFEDFEKIRKNSREYIFEEVKTLLPVLVTLTIMTILSTACNMAIMLRQSIRHYVIYYINGLSWRECFGLHIRALFFLEAGILLVTLLGIGICQAVGLIKSTVISIGFCQVISCICTCLLFSLISLMVAAGQIKGKTAKDVMQEQSMD